MSSARKFCLIIYGDEHEAWMSYTIPSRVDDSSLSARHTVRDVNIELEHIGSYVRLLVNGVDTGTGDKANG